MHLAPTRRWCIHDREEAIVALDKAAGAATRCGSGTNDRAYRGARPSMSRRHPTISRRSRRRCRQREERSRDGTRACINFSRFPVFSFNQVYFVARIRQRRANDGSRSPGNREIARKSFTCDSLRDVTRREMLISERETTDAVRLVVCEEALDQSLQRGHGRPPACIFTKATSTGSRPNSDRLRA